MPLLSAEFKTNMAVKYEEAKIYARNAYKKATTRTPKEPKEQDDGSPKKSMTMKEAYFKRMEKGTLKDNDTNPMDRMAAMRLVDAGLWDAEETEKRQCAEGGAGRESDRAAFEEDMRGTPLLESHEKIVELV